MKTSITLTLALAALTLGETLSLKQENPVDFTSRQLATFADTAAGAAQEKKDVAACHTKTDGYINALSSTAKFTDNKFHDCWRNATQVFQFLDKLVATAPNLLTKIDSIGKTFEGRDIPAYKISTGASTSKRALVANSLIHSREWQAGGAVFYVISGLLDGLRGGDSRVKSIFDKYDWYFVPILNIDGYEFTWADKGDRLWRKNRRVFSVSGKQYTGVDLNRNFGPTSFFDFDKSSRSPSSDIYPGTGVLSEPETAAVWKLITKLPNKLAGFLDVHTYATAVLRPFSNQKTESAEPYKSKLITLGQSMVDAIQSTKIPYPYENVMGATGNALAYGTFKDAVFMELGNIPAYTLELESPDLTFISDQNRNRDVGNRTLASFVAFSEGIEKYWQGLPRA